MEDDVGSLTPKPRKVLALTGIRSEYFFQKPILEAIMAHPDLELELIVAGAHLSPIHGHTVKTIEADGMPVVERIENLLYSDRDAGRLKGAALQLQTLAHVLDKRRPDWLLAVGDREEPLTLAMCGVYLNIPILHYSAGDRVVGNVDDMVRHAVSRLSHLLVTTSEDSRQRLIKAGEEEWRVHNLGHAGLDRIRKAPVMSDPELAQALGIERMEERVLLLIQHPLSSEIEAARAQMEESLAAAEALKMQTFISYPNSDAGGAGMIEAIQGYENKPGFHVFRNIPDIPFVNLLRRASVLLGNSSLGLLEAPFLKLPAINTGRRQSARGHAENVFFVDHDRGAIADQVRLILEDGATRKRIESCANPFGDGRTGERVAELLAKTPIDRKLLSKDLSY